LVPFSQRAVNIGDKQANHLVRVHLPWAICSLAAVTMESGIKPNLRCHSFSGADAPNVFMPITRPRFPMYRSHPNVDACSTATRATRLGGKTLSWYSCG